MLTFLVGLVVGLVVGPVVFLAVLNTIMEWGNGRGRDG